MFAFCTKNIPSIKIFNIKKDQMSDTRQNQEERFKEGKTVPGTRSYHFYEPFLKERAVKFKRVNEDSEYCGKAVFRNILDEVKWQPMQFVACIYDGFWWIGLILELNRELEDAHVKFMHPHGPTNSVYWPRRNDICWVPFSQILCIVQAPTKYTGRKYKIDEKDIQKVDEACQ